MRKSKFNEFLDLIKSMRRFPLTRRDLDDFFEEKEYKKIYQLLKKKFDIKYDFDTFFYHSNKVDKTELDNYYNYLLSLNKEYLNIFVWNEISLGNDNLYTGLTKKMFDKKSKCYKYWSKHTDMKYPYNYTKEESDGFITLRPFRRSEIKSFLTELYRNRKIEEIDDGLWYGIQFVHNPSDFFFSIILDKKLIGVVGLSRAHNEFVKTNSIYNILYYIIPKYRNNKYATRAVDLLIDMAFNDKIIIDQQNKYYDYLIERKPLDVKIIYAVINDNNIYSKKIAENLGLRLIGKYKNISDIDEIELWDYYKTEKKDGRLKKSIKNLLDYVEENLMEDLTTGKDARIFPIKDIELTLDYVIDFDKELRDNYLFYLSFTPYKDFELQAIETLINKYPLDGYEAKKAAYYIENDPKKSLEICKAIKEKYKNDNETSIFIQKVEEWATEKGEKNE